MIYNTLLYLKGLSAMKNILIDTDCGVDDSIAIMMALAGFIMDKTTRASLFPFSIVFFILAFLMMFGVKRGEAESEEDAELKKKFIEEHVDLD